MRFHDYGEIYQIQGLYEQIFYAALNSVPAESGTEKEVVRKVRSCDGMSPSVSVCQESPQLRRHESVRSSPSGTSPVAAA